MKTYRVSRLRRWYRAVQYWWHGGRYHVLRRGRCRRCDAIIDVHGIEVAGLCPTCGVFWGRMSVVAFVRMIWACGPREDDLFAQKILEAANYCTVPGMPDSARTNVKGLTDKDWDEIMERFAESVRQQHEEHADA